jgi:hypothetical protein
VGRGAGAARKAGKSTFAPYLNHGRVRPCVVSVLVMCVPREFEDLVALDELFAGLVEGRVAVVFTPDAVVRAAVAWALWTGPEVYRRVEVADCSITTVGVLAGGRGLVRTNENAHLEGLAREP